MMKNGFLFAALSIFLACTNTPERRYEKMSNGWCDCVEPLLAINDRARNLASKPDSTAENQAKLAKIFQELEAAQKKATECSTILKDKYGVIKNEEWPAAEPFFWKNCSKMKGHADILKGMLGE